MDTLHPTQLDPAKGRCNLRHPRRAQYVCDIGSNSGRKMTSKDELKRAVCDAIDRHADTIIDLGETILRNPETGFNEVKTAALVAGHMTALGLEPRTGLALTGVKGRLAGRAPGPRLAF